MKDLELNIQWFPGHMTKARRMMQENLSSVDALCEILDARIPSASRNPDIDSLCGDKPRLIVLNRADLADPTRTAQWKQHYGTLGYRVIDCDARSGKGSNAFVPTVKALMKERVQQWQEKGQPGRKAAAVGDRPGLTRGKQWIGVDAGLELLDTPGILWPKFEDAEAGELLAVTNAVKAEVVDREALAANFIRRLCRMYPEAVRSRYKIEPDPEKGGYDLLTEAARKRGFLISGGEVDLERMANTLLTEYHSGKLGRLTLEMPPES